MAIAIHTSPELTGSSAERFVWEAENRKASRGPLTNEEKLKLEKVLQRSRELKYSIEKKYGIQI